MMMAAAIANPSVSIQDLSLNFGVMSVLKTLNLDVAEGEFIVLLGPAGMTIADTFSKKNPNAPVTTQ